MADSKTQFLMGEDEPTEAEPIYLSSNGHTQSQYPMSDQELIKTDHPQLLNQLLIYLNNRGSSCQKSYLWRQHAHTVPISHNRVTAEQTDT